MLENVLVPIVIMTSMFAMIFGIVYLGSRERMAMIDKGMDPRLKNSRPRPFVSLKNGLLLLGAGAGLLAAYLLDTLVFGNRMAMAGTAQHEFIKAGNTTINDFSSNNTALYFALIAIGGGLGLFLSYRIEKKEWLDKKGAEELR